MAVEVMIRLFKQILENERTPEEWRNVLVASFNNNGELQTCHRIHRNRVEPHKEVVGKSSKNQTKDRSEDS